jgi:phage baseplate assembly protein gpV
MAIKESVGTNNGWSQGGLSFFVKNNGTKIDALSINSAGNVTLTQDLTVSGGDITGANSKSIDLGEQNSSDITFKGTEDAMFKIKWWLHRIYSSRSIPS